VPALPAAPTSETGGPEITHDVAPWDEVATWLANVARRSHARHSWRCPNSAPPALKDSLGRLLKDPSLLPAQRSEVVHAPAFIRHGRSSVLTATEEKLRRGN